MKPKTTIPNLSQPGAMAGGVALIFLGVVLSATGQLPAPAEDVAAGRASFPERLASASPPPFGPGGPMQEIKLIRRFDLDADKRLNVQERKAAREYLAQTRRDQPAFGPRPRRVGSGETSPAPATGRKLTPKDVKTFTNAPAYDESTLRTFFLEFDNSDWEQELADFNNTDVEVPAMLTVDGSTYRDVGVHFRGASSFMMVEPGRKRSLNLSLDWVRGDQNLGGYRTLNLLNAHEDPTFLRTVLYYHIAREFIPSPKANFVRVVINGECWGIYVSAQQFNKDFVKDWFGTTKGARWKVPGGPGGRAGLEYLGENPEPYKQLYEIKTQEDPEVWAGFIRLCRVLNTTPTNELAKALEPLLDVDGALKFLALENVLVNNDGYWVRASDYSIYQDLNGRFHVFPHDANETFSSSGGPGFGGGPGGPGGFGPGPMLAGRMIAQADQNHDRQLSQAEFLGLAGVWFAALDRAKAGKLAQEQFAANLDEILPPPGGPGGFGPPPGDGRRGFGPPPFVASGLFAAMDASKDGVLTRADLQSAFAQWWAAWGDGSGMLSEELLSKGCGAVLPLPAGGRGPGRGGPGAGGVELDPLVAANDETKPLLSKLLAVTEHRARYLDYVRQVAAVWLDWKRLGPLATQYHSLIADDVKVDTRKLDSFGAFLTGLAGESAAGSRGPGARISVKTFAERRRAYLLKHPAIAQVPTGATSQP